MDNQIATVETPEFLAYSQATNILTNTYRQRTYCRERLFDMSDHIAALQQFDACVKDVILAEHDWEQAARAYEQVLIERAIIADQHEKREETLAEFGVHKGAIGYFEGRRTAEQNADREARRRYYLRDRVDVGIKIKRDVTQPEDRIQ